MKKTNAVKTVEMVEKTPEQREVHRKKIELQNKILQEKTKFLFLRFYLDEKNQSLIERAEASLRNDSVEDSAEIWNELWEKLFRCVHGRYPLEACQFHWSICPFVAIPQIIDRYMGKRAQEIGQTDPLWDEFFDIKGRDALNARRWALKTRNKFLAHESADDFDLAEIAKALT